MKSLTYINIETVDDINLKEITLQSLSYRYKDKTGKTYAVRYNLQEHQLEIINIKTIFENKKLLNKNSKDSPNNEGMYGNILEKYGIENNKNKTFIKIFDKKEIIFIPEFLLSTNEPIIIEIFKKAREVNISPNVFLYDWKEELSGAFLSKAEILQGFSKNY